MAALFLDDNKTTDDGDAKENVKKWYVYINKNNNFTRASRYFVHLFSFPSLYHYDMELPNFTSPQYGVCEHYTKIVAFFFST